MNSNKLGGGGVGDDSDTGYTDSSVHSTVMRRITTFRSTTDRIYDDGPII